MTKSWLYPTSDSSRRLVIATTAFQSDQAPAVNCEKIARTVDTIMQAHPNVELILFGEVILGWYIPSRLVELAEPVPGPSTDFLSQVARKHGIYLSFGIPERNAGKLHNAQVLLNPQGQVQAIHRKWNLKNGEKKANFQPGATNTTLTDIKGIRTGMIICADARHPQTMRALMKNRPELILFSLADDQDESWFVAKANARLYVAWLVSANRYGHEKADYWNGHTVITDPLGNLCFTFLDQEGYLVHELRFTTGCAWYQTLARNLWVKVSLVRTR